MTIHPADQPVTDPFWAAVRQRHPDVDLVLLPPEGPADAPTEDPADLVDADVLRTDLETVRDHAEALGLDAASRQERIELGGTPGSARATARVVRRGQDQATLEALAGVATDRGWSLDRLAGRVALLVGRSEQLTLRVTFAEPTGVLVAEVSGPDRRVGTQQARALVGGDA